VKQRRDSLIDGVPAGGSLDCARRETAAHATAAHCSGRPGRTLTFTVFISRGFQDAISGWRSS